MRRLHRLIYIGCVLRTKHTADVAAKSWQGLVWCGLVYPAASATLLIKITVTGRKVWLPLNKAKVRFISWKKTSIYIYHNTVDFPPFHHHLTIDAINLRWYIKEPIDVLNFLWNIKNVEIATLKPLNGRANLLNLEHKSLFNGDVEWLVSICALFKLHSDNLWDENQNISIIENSQWYDRPNYTHTHVNINQTSPHKRLPLRVKVITWTFR